MPRFPPTPNVFMPPMTKAFISLSRWRDLRRSRTDNQLYGSLIEELISFLKSETPDGNVVGQYTLYKYDRTYHTDYYDRNETLKATMYYDALYEMYTTNTLGIHQCTSNVLMNLDIGEDDNKTNIVPTLLNMPAGMLYHEIKFELIRTDLKPPTPPPKSIA